MKKTLIAILLLATHFINARGQATTDNNQQVIADFINNVKKQNKTALAEKVVFPLRRDAPIPPVKTKQEFLERYNDIFDAALTKLIIESQPDKDWKDMGWRGMMLDQGKVWLNGDGKLVAVNYESTIEKRKREALIAEDRKELNKAVRNYQRPVYVLETAKFRIRIDDMGKDNYRYSSWKIQSSKGDVPDLVIENGKVLHEGTGGNHRYQFKNDGYLYECDFTLLGVDNQTPAVLKIYKDGKTLLSQPATIIE
ncbi:hypothetical protein [Chitinophaga rhizophila]|uniref:GLPGLI family protein n=1 Tax=Chitinophaga rhizophila TaxID=2866212 RepID=A0ABS7G892_9BACT|nr:hypothetical protein [Chitinophaga rhizophila]MBW8683345.1 hypothetical protein [Chitinophaga rhizophila]